MKTIKFPFQEGRKQPIGGWPERGFRLRRYRLGCTFFDRYLCKTHSPFLILAFKLLYARLYRNYRSWIIAYSDLTTFYWRLRHRYATTPWFHRICNWEEFDGLIGGCILALCLQVHIGQNLAKSRKTYKPIHAKAQNKTTYSDVVKSHSPETEGLTCIILEFAKYAICFVCETILVRSRFKYDIGTIHLRVLANKTTFRALQPPDLIIMRIRLPPTSTSS